MISATKAVGMTDEELSHAIDYYKKLVNEKWSVANVAFLSILLDEWAERTDEKND